MAWSASFKTALRAINPRPIFVLRTRRTPDSGLYTSWSICTHPGIAGPALIASGSVSFGRSEVQPRDWSASIGAVSVGIIAADDRSLLRLLQKGQIVELMMGFAGWELAKFERVALGQVWDYTGGRRSSRA
jgi:hypothetical protein